MPVYMQWITTTGSSSSTWTAPTYISTTASTTWFVPITNQTSVTVWYQPQYHAQQEWFEHQRLTAHETERQRRVLHRHSDEAKERARNLLLGHLTAAQRETFEKNKWFVVEGGQSQTRYRINDSSHMVANIDVMSDETDKIRHRLCGHCGLDDVPIGDQLLAQKLMLEYDEDRFLRLANRHPAMAA